MISKNDFPILEFDTNPVAQFRGFDYGAIIYGGDDVASEKLDNRDWMTHQGIRYNLIMLCKELVQEM